MKKIVGGLSVAVAIAAVVAATLWLQLRGEREHGGAGAASLQQAGEPMAVADAEAAADALTPDGETLASEPAAPAVQSAAATSPAAMSPPATVPAASQTTASAEEAMNTRIADALQAMARPEARDSLKMMMRGVMAQMYPDLATEVGLDAAGAEALIDLLAERAGDSGAELGLLTGAGTQDAAARRELQRQMVEKEKSQEQAVRTLLGERYPRWEDYQATAAARTQMQQLRTTLGASGNPLSDAQADQLVTTFASELRRMQRDQRDWMYSDAAINSPNLMQETLRRTVDSQMRMADAAAPLLTAAQQEQFRRQVDMQANVLRATMGAADSAGARGAQGGPAAPAAP